MIGAAVHVDLLRKANIARVLYHSPMLCTSHGRWGTPRRYLLSIIYKDLFVDTLLGLEKVSMSLVTHKWCLFVDWPNITRRTPSLQRISSPRDCIVKVLIVCSSISLRPSTPLRSNVSSFKYGSVSHQISKDPHGPRP